MGWTQTPGIRAKYAVITSTCRSNHGDERAVDIALERLREEYLKCAENWPLDKDASFHFVLTVDREGRDGTHLAP